MKILLTCVGRRVELLQAFINASRLMNVDLIIYGTDCSLTAPALLYCNYSFHVHRVDDSRYIPELLDICINEKIDALIPTIDTDILSLSKHQQAFADIGTRVVICSRDTVDICLNKIKTTLTFAECGLNSPKTELDISSYSSGFPCFIKPIFGSSSIDAFRADNHNDLELYANRIPQYLIQPFIEGQEYTVDIFCDFDGHPIYITPRERLAVRSGEVLKTRIVQDRKIINDCLKLVDKLKPCGAITVQLIRQTSTLIDFYLEVNPRFGGGVPLSIKSGADSAAIMIKLLLGEKIEYIPNAACGGSIYSRYDQSILVVREALLPLGAVVFDLDDTLYAEREYVFSGYSEVANMLPNIPDAYIRLCNLFQFGKPTIDQILLEYDMYSQELKNECLKQYRRHKPKIELYNGIRELLIDLRQRKVRIGILTDGRPEGQRNKIKALGLEEIVDEIIVTDELGGEEFRKPNDIAYRIMQQRLHVPFERILYVGDNPHKDFISPLQLDMQVLHFRNQDGIDKRNSSMKIMHNPCNLLNVVSNTNEMIEYIRNMYYLIE